ncbi:MAG: cyclodeaminase/cyclohydrolase family protein [Acholeplasmataceae bacterium]|jgi:formiminotetrahydrofolate cyclodeaminase|nr:cyclodeaminase/cyclohydrolase family protein [Acholeplasmataceae bacterium]
MKLVEMNVRSFIDEVDSKSPAPGGGSVSSLMSAMGVALTRMVGHLTVEKKKFLALDPKIQFEFKDIIFSLTGMKEELIHLIDADTEAFNRIMSAYQLPKSTDNEIEMRKAKIQEGTLQAIMVPLKVASISLAALHQFDFVLTYGNKQTVSDIGVATLALSSGALGAIMNVLINLPGLDDEIARKQYSNQVENLERNIVQVRDQLLGKVYQHLKIS